MQLWKRISHFGIRPGLSPEDERAIVVVNRICAILSVFVFTSVIINWILGSYFFIPVLSFALLALLAIYVFNYKGLYAISKVTLMLISFVVLFYMCITAGLGSGLEFYFISLIVLPVLIFKKTRVILLFQALCIVCLIGQKVYVDIVRPEDPSRAIEYRVFYIVNSIYSCALIMVTIFFFRNLIRRREHELEESYQTISSKNKQLEHANKELDTFTYSVSHDLRAPLRAIDGFSNFLERNPSIKADAEASEYLTIIRQNAVQMRQLIEDLLKLSRASKVALNKEPINMEELVKEVVEDFQTEARQTGATIKVNELLSAHGDHNLIKQVWMNLISNALKYSAKIPRPDIEIGSQKKDRQTVYYVKDNGIGFNMEHAGGLFQPFRRLHAGNEYSGTGVGLAIVSNIIRAHEGMVWAESKEGKGSAFYFSLPA